MSILTVKSRITKRVEVKLPDNHILFTCKHGVTPKLYEIYTGKGGLKFQGSTAECGNEECLCFSYTAECAAGKWNRFHAGLKNNQ